MNDAHETLVRDVLHRATDDLTVPATSLAATAVVRGRSLRALRRLGESLQPVPTPGGATDDRP